MQGSRKATATSPLISPNACYPFIKVGTLFSLEHVDLLTYSCEDYFYSTMCYGLVFCADYLLQMFFKVRNNLFRIILPTDRHPIGKDLQTNCDWVLMF